MPLVAKAVDTCEGSAIAQWWELEKAARAVVAHLVHPDARALRKLAAL
jgi:hypothetical protein